MDANLLRYLAFVKTVECGSFTGAAQQLHYSQSGVSRMIAELEKQWRLTLLERSRAGVRLTSQGAELLPYVRRVCEEHRQLQNQVDEINGLQSGLIRIGTFSSVATHWLPPIIQAFQRDYPHIRYELLLGDYEEIEEWILEGRVDAGFLSLPTGAPLESIFLQEDPLLAVLPEGHPLSRLPRVPVAALCQEPFLLIEKGGKAEYSLLFDRLGLTPQTQFTTWDDYAVMSMVESGLGVSVLPQLILRRNPYRIVARPLEPPASRQIGLALRSSQSASPAMRRFLRYLPYRQRT